MIDSRANLLDRIQQVIGDLGECLVPAHLLPFPFAALACALERLKHTLLSFKEEVPRGALLAPHWIEVG